MLVTKQEYDDLKRDLANALWRTVWYQGDTDGEYYGRHIPHLFDRACAIADNLLAAAGYTTAVDLGDAPYYHPGEEGNPHA